jgi:hypothetical protein
MCERNQCECNRSRDHVVNLNSYSLSKQITHLLRAVQPQLKSPDLKIHFQNLVEDLISESEYVCFEFKFRTKLICQKLEKYIPGSIAAILCYDAQTLKFKCMSAPNLPEKLWAPLMDCFNLNPVVHSSMNDDIRTHHFFEEPRWEPHRHFFAKMNIASCWIIPIRRSLHNVCTLAVFLNKNRKPDFMDLKHLEKKKKLFNHWFPDCPAKFMVNKSSS